MRVIVKLPFFYGKGTCHDTRVQSSTLSTLESTLCKIRAGRWAEPAYILIYGSLHRHDYDHYDLGKPGADDRVLIAIAATRVRVAMRRLPEPARPWRRNGKARMRYYVDTEFNGTEGQLLGMVLARNACGLRPLA